jgi:tRNA(Ser,Leu) C12 N-acetylase TAN1
VRPAVGVQSLNSFFSRQMSVALCPLEDKRDISLDELKDTVQKLAKERKQKDFQVCQSLTDVVRYTSRYKVVRFNFMPDCSTRSTID